MDEQNRNLILATVLSFLVVTVWFWLNPPPDPALTELPPNSEASTDVAGITPSAVEDSNTPASTPSATAEVVDAPRVAIETPELTGSLSLQGARIDDLSLLKYRETLDADADIVRLLKPVGEPNAYFASFGWVAAEGITADQVPGPDTIWSVESGDTLTPETPVTLRWDNGAGQIFRTTVSVDEEYMFDFAQSVENTTTADVTLRPYGLLRRHGEPEDLKRFFILHEGLVRMTDGSKYFDTRDLFQAEAVMPLQTVAAGDSAEVSTRLFAGAKEWEAIRNYEREDGVTGYLDSIDWGWFFFLTKPIFWLLHYLNVIIGNMGWAIIGLTFILKIIVLPLAYKSYVSMAKMKELQPEMEALKERHGEDRQAMQQGMMKLYKENKVNPAAGCLPILLQIPIFFALYKVIFVTIELRHAPWLGWLTDLSAPDPSSFINLFGLLPWAAPAPGSLLSLIFIGIMPIILGVSMWMQQKLNPAPTDPTQKMIFAWMPWVFMFMLGGFASGLVLYWITNNIITFAQQYLIMRSHGAKPDVFGNITASFKKDQKPAEPEKPANKSGKPSKSKGK